MHKLKLKEVVKIIMHAQINKQESDFAHSFGFISLKVVKFPCSFHTFHVNMYAWEDNMYPCSDIMNAMQRS